MASTAPYGSWTSPITSDLISSAAVRLGQVTLIGDELYALESRPTEAGRYVLVRHAGGATDDVSPPGSNVRTRVHESGGAPYAIAGGTLWFASFADQRLYRQDRGGAAVAITPEPPVAAAWRYADPQVTPDRRALVCVRERHD